MDYYELLGVEKDASYEEIKIAYRQKSKKMHPDVGGDETEFSELNIAYNTLSDPDARNIYDKVGKGKFKSIDLYKEAQNFLIQLFDNIVENVGGVIGIETLDELYDQCNARIQIRQRDIQFLKRTKEGYEKGLGQIKKKDDDSETMFDSVLKERIKNCEEQIALAKMDVQTIELSLNILKDYYPNEENPEVGIAQKELDFQKQKNKDINKEAQSILEIEG